MIAIFIVVATAAAVGAAGGGAITSAADAARALEPVAGRFAEALFGIGLFGASVLAATIMPLSTAFVICEAFGWESGVGKRFRDAPIFFGIYTLVLALGAIAVLLVPEGDLVAIIVGTRTCRASSCRSCSCSSCCWSNDRRLMGSHANRRGGNVLAWGAVAVDRRPLNAVLLGTALLGVLGVSVG